MIDIIPQIRRTTNAFDNGQIYLSPDNLYVYLDDGNSSWWQEAGPLFILLRCMPDRRPSKDAEDEAEAYAKWCDITKRPGIFEATNVSDTMPAPPHFYASKWRRIVEKRMLSDFADSPNTHLVEMQPAEYLRLAGSPDRWVGRLNIARMEEWPDLPQLDVCAETGRVLTQKGRHRVAAARASGIKSVPIAVTFYPSLLLEAGDFEALKAWNKVAHPLPPQPWWPCLDLNSEPAE